MKKAAAMLVFVGLACSSLQSETAPSVPREVVGTLSHDYFPLVTTATVGGAWECFIYESLRLFRVVVDARGEGSVVMAVGPTNAAIWRKFLFRSLTVEKGHLDLTSFGEDGYKMRIAGAGWATAEAGTISANLEWLGPSENVINKFECTFHKDSYDQIKAALSKIARSR